MASYLDTGLHDQLRKLEHIHLKHQVVTVWYVKNQIRVLEQRTAQLDPSPAEAVDTAEFLLHFVPLLVKLILAQRQVQIAMLRWIANLNRAFGMDVLRPVSTAIVAGVLKSSRGLRRQFVMQTLIHATRFDTQIVLAEMDRRDMNDRAVRVEMHRYMSTIFKEWSPYDMQYRAPSPSQPVLPTHAAAPPSSSLPSAPIAA
ncbi:hypothetical protein H310_11945 [Aphanomyces invadans]|uniref:CLASP N-terminal domain-containing protein n=1 Tax=Aphanomyces invadans TaxID=157072 RepID=A0A024TKZ6_9STRA|nr:hypothetical protein H310_11945 [Aphanomyces invadans]ETV94286.1 hypothetical protein H310_11945 [Aphanomyces invadans]|eukprot:XP_008877048.1 hypothetical protein H310_11945 [Aphanomyces invadans]